MADAYTGTTVLSNIVLAAVDQYVRSVLRHSPMWRQLCDTRPVNVDRAGSSVKLFTQSDLAVATTPLNELTDPDVVALPNPTSVTLTPNEYGNISVTSIKAKNTAFADIDPMQMNLIAYNMRDSLDALVSVVANGGTNVYYSKAGDAGTNTATNQLVAADILTAKDVNKAVTKLRTGAAAGKFGDLYAAYVHPNVSADLRSQTGSGTWQDLHKYAAPGEFWPGTVGVFNGAAFIETARAKSATDGAGPPSAPTLNAPTTATTGGTLAAGTYYYKITATNSTGESAGSNEVSQVTTGATSTVGLSWGAIAGATGYKVYRATVSGGQSTSPALVATVGAVTSYTDTGTAVSAGAVPASATPPPATVYRTVFAGQEAIAEGVVVEPGVRVGNIPDKFGRFFPLGWYGFLGWTRFREEALVRVESGSGY